MPSGALTPAEPHGWTQGRRPAASSAMILLVISSQRLLRSLAALARAAVLAAD
jgi:hypothetical protein